MNCHCQIDQPEFMFERCEHFDDYRAYMVDVAVIFGANRTNADKELHEAQEFELKLKEVCSKHEFSA